MRHYHCDRVRARRREQWNKSHDGGAFLDGAQLRSHPRNDKGNVIPSVVEGCATITAIECEREGASSGIRATMVARSSTALNFVRALGMTGVMSSRALSRDAPPSLRSSARAKARAV